MNISEKVMNVYKSDSFMLYRVGCSCMSEDCDLSFFIEANDDGQISLNLEKKLIWNEHNISDVLFKRILLRIKTSLKILFTGQLEQTGH